MTELSEARKAQLGPIEDRGVCQKAFAPEDSVRILEAVLG